MPAIVALPEPAMAEKVTPDGSAPLVFDTVTGGSCGVVVTVKVPKVPAVKRVEFALVKLGVGGGLGLDGVTSMVTCAVFESAEPLLALYSNVSCGALEPSLT